MTIQILLKIGAVGILVALLNQILKHSGKEEHAYLLNLAACSAFDGIHHCAFLGYPVHK